MRGHARGLRRGAIAIVTGGGRGIGRAIASSLVREGLTVWIADVDDAFGSDTARAIGASFIHLDVRDPDAWRAAVDRIRRDDGPVEILVNNAGIMPIGAFLTQDPAADRRQFDINLWGVANGLRAVLPGMIALGRGHVVNVASVAGRVGTPHAAMYSATKHAVIGLTEAVRHEVRSTGVRLSYVLPSLVETELIAGTGRPIWPPVSRPEHVADAVVDALKTGRVEIYVPRAGRLSVLLPALLPRRLTERIGRWLGIDQMFATVDGDRRANYAKRTAD